LLIENNEMANDQLKSAVAANRDVPSSKPGPFQDCRDVVHIAVFFDGTGNNKDEDEEKRRWSNVARMFFASQAYAEQSAATYPIYISGVGTPYNGKAVNWLTQAEVWKEDNLKGMGFGGGGDRRLDQGDDAVNDRLRDVLIANAKTLGGTISKYASASSSKSFGEVNAALAKHRLIKVINLSIFGFSRGAALARAFSNRVIKSCEQKGHELLYQGYPLRMNFMGLFDTVASFGLPAQNMRLPFEERELIVSPKVERCVHFIAGHEIRFAFPVDLIRKNGQLAGAWEEKTYPGVHSDVGGGYEPFDQQINNNYARIPMRDMMRESILSGARMIGYDDIRKTRSQLFQKLFECKSETEAAYKNYLAGCGAVSGPIENQMKQHMRMLYSTYGTMHRSGRKTAGEIRREDKYVGSRGMAWEVDKYRKAAKSDKAVRFHDPKYGYAQYVKPYDWQLNAWDANAPAGVVDFVAQFVHDSKVDFIGNVEPFSYFKPRGVQESTISIWQEGGNWVSDKVRAVAAAADSGFNTAKKEAAHAYDVAAQKTAEAADAAKRKAQEAAAAANEAYETTAKAASDAADAVKQKAQEAANAAEQKINEAEVGAVRIYEKGKYWIQSTATDAVDKTGKLVGDAKKELGY
jgi:Uncharacterized alpha/beta hydrolase domain (DUF2235)